MRRLLVALLIVAVLAAVGYTLWTWKGTAHTAADPWQAIPTQSAIIVQLHEPWAAWDRATHTSQLWGAFSSAPGVAASGRLLERISARMENDAALRNELSSNTVLIAILRSGGDRIGSLFTGALNGGGSLAEQALAEVLGADAQAMQLISSGNVVQVHPDTALPPLSLCLRSGLWLLASDPGIMDEALLQLKSGTSIADDPALNKALSTLGAGTDAHLLAHTTRSQRLMNTWWLPDALEDVDLPSGWAAMDMRVRPDALLISGLLVPEQEHPLITAMQEQGTGRSSAARALPARVTHLDVQHIADASAWQASRATANENNEHADALFSWVQGGIGIAVQPGATLAEDLRWAFFGTEDPDAATEQLQQLCVTPCDTLNHRGQRITRLPLANAHERLLGKTFEGIERPWWVVLGDVVLFSDAPAALTASIDAWNDGSSLAEDARSAAWFDRLSAEAGRSVWIDVARSQEFLRRGLKTEASAATLELDSLWSSIGGLSLQVSPGQHGFQHIMIGLQYAPVEVRHSGTAWSTALGAAVQRQPDIVRNHTNNTREVLVQDVQHRLHLLASTGKVLWTRQLDGPILGIVHQVDRFRNDKLQLLLNTAGTVYLIDRNGKDLGGFPLTVPTGAAAALSVFDYEQERDYRIIIPAKDGRLLNYGLDGLLVKGWETPKLGAPAISAVEHLRIKGKDHLIAVGSDGTVHVFDRRGAVRERVTLKLDSAQTLLQLLPGTELPSSRLVWSTATGRVFVSTLAGNTSELAAPGTQHAMLVDLEESGTEEGLYVRGDSLMLAVDGKARLLRSFGEALDPRVTVSQLGQGNNVITVLRKASGQISVVDAQGAELEGSPVGGVLACPPTDLDLDGRMELVTVAADGTVTAHRALIFTTRTP
jgi:hypothetical protein